MAGRQRHIVLRDRARAEQYTSTRSGRDRFRRPPRDRGAHARSLKTQLETAKKQALAGYPPGTDADSIAITLEFASNPDFDLLLESLGNRQQGIEVANVTQRGNVTRATVFVPPGKTAHFVRRLDRYAREDTDKGEPRHAKLVESISEIKHAVVYSFWTDHERLYPKAKQEAWWEVWIRGGSLFGAEVAGEFTSEAERLGLEIAERRLEFAERTVVLARCTREKWAEDPRLLNFVAELRSAKIPISEWLDLSPRDQAEFIEDALSRITPPSGDSAAVCILDTGVNRGHPLLALALDKSDVSSVEPDWGTADAQGHGTEMAGLALYGCLRGLLEGDGQVALDHRLESVKIFPSNGANEPENYGAITQEAVARAETESPYRTRVVCLTTTADDRDQGRPTLWSSAIDQMTSGQRDGKRRLVFVCAGNIRDLTDPRSDYEYPRTNHEVEGIEDPAQSWNALTIGAHTEQVVIQSPDFADWSPVAEKGTLCPSSRTSLPWKDEKRDWPIKPDLVLEGGNFGKDADGTLDWIDDLCLLTTSVDPTGSGLKPTGETSGATAQAARMGAIVSNAYPEIWPETVRALLVHAASWTKAMEAEFPAGDDERRLRCYGFGVPSLESALWSASNAVTLVCEENLRPFRDDGGTVKTNEMRLHQLPWPVSVLEDLHDAPVKMRVTLSYFTEPNPGSRGWTKKHLYQSHGLRFDVIRPTETVAGFHKRVNREARDDPKARFEHDTESQSWALGLSLRSRGSIHSDWWEGTAQELARCGHIAVFPVAGWWKNRRHLAGWKKDTRYSLVVTISTPRTDVDLYAEIENQVQVQPEIEI